MKSWLRGGLIVFLLIAGLVGGGLGFMTVAVLRLEREQQEARAQADLASNLRLAILHLDSCVIPDLAREEGRLYNHYSFISRHPRTLVQRNQKLVPDATVLQMSPLLTAELPDWMLLHFQADESGWSSPQVPPAQLVEMLRKYSPLKDFRNRTKERASLLDELKTHLAAKTLLTALDARSHPPSAADGPVLLAQDNFNKQVQIPAQQLDNQPQPQQVFGQGAYPQFGNVGQFGGMLNNPFDRGNRGRIGQSRANADQQNSVTETEININDIQEQGAGWFNSANFKSNITTSASSLKMTPLERVWVQTGEGHEYLVLVRELFVEHNANDNVKPSQQPAPPSRICQGVVLDVNKLREYLLDEVKEVFPGSTLEPVRDLSKADPLRTMTLLPLSLEPASINPLSGPEGWTPLRIGLALAWVAAIVALLAVGLGAWSLIDLSERRFRFVSAVTHELRTPLTTLRLYLDMLLGGMVRDEQKKEEYLRTLNGEADRLSRLVNNVLDFSRLEKQRPRLQCQPVAVAVVLDQVRDTWQGRCQDAGKILVVENETATNAELTTDPELVQQVLANLIDNACKYSRDADDPHIRLRARSIEGQVVFEVEDRGPGVPARERRTIFRAFRRGLQAEATGGGVGLGLALAHRWARLLRGRLSLGSASTGACFRLELPLGS
jgi:signal transduction histidine kinase